ncbi:acyl carrier protein [Actinomadura sp. ATCC 31491]|uniref:Acyl carrier protein n=1 Tax=Actinomadura luzonensis TaxID=2805427 RepID=A0ABT0FTP3_9ACTN|nr:acyl carrier protein [Actinomadura luzonensis]MCK2215702.1 acyl carrier protein [Actinomadura luzonensis]
MSLERRLAELIAEVSEGAVGAEEALAGEHSLSALGLTSLARIRLVDAIEDVFGVDVDLGAGPSAELSTAERVGDLAAAVAGLLERGS